MAAGDAREHILELLRQTSEGHVSGEEICRVLGVSRAAVWKHIRALRELGYDIQGVASRGYRLLAAPERLLAAEVRAGLGTRRIGGDVRVFDRIDSTNTVAHRLGAEGGADGTVVVAEEQTAGRGRLGRSWASPAGVNLYLSVLLRPELPPQRTIPLTFLAAVAVARALAETCGVQAELKWPNDLLLNGRKVAGLLNEMQAETERVNYLVLGIGLNLNMTPDQFPPLLRYPATSVRIASGRSADRLQVLQSLLRWLDRLYDEFLAQGPEPILRAWDERCAFRGKPVQVSGGDQARGVLVGIDADGALLLDTAAGRRRILSGDLQPLSGKD